jgi:hypothetical protein
MEFPQKMQHSRPDVAASVRHVGALQEAYFGWAAPKRSRGLTLRCLCLFEASASAEFESPKSEYFTGFEASDNYASGHVGAG